MQKIINKVKFGKDTYYKVLNVVNDQCVNMNVYKTVGDSYREIIPMEADKALIKAIMNRKNEIALSQEELKDFDWKITILRENNRPIIYEDIAKSFKAKCSVKTMSAFAGITYCVLQFDEKMAYDIVKIILDENGRISAVEPISSSHVELIIMDIATKLSLYTKPKFIQASEDTIYGILEDGQTVVVAEMSIGDLEIQGKKAYAIKKLGNTYRLYNHEEITDEISVKIQRNATIIMDTLIDKIGAELLK